MNIYYMIPVGEKCECGTLRNKCDSSIHSGLLKEFEGIHQNLFLYIDFFSFIIN